MRRLRRLAVVLLLLFGGLLGGSLAVAAPASAAPVCLPLLCHPKHWWDYGVTGSVDLNVFSCQSPPTPSMPGRGFSGWIDSGPPSYDPNATGVYDTVQYPPSWSTYDIGCGGAAADPGAVLDTTIGNWLKGAATTMVAFADSLHRLVSPPTFLSHLDPLLAQGSAALRDALFTPFIGLSVLVLGTLIILSARRRQLPRAVESVAWALLVMTAATALWSYPVQAGRAVDQLATATIGNVNQALLGEPSNAPDPSSARATLLTDNDLYKQWLQGELGSDSSAVAVKYGRLLLLSQSYTYAEAAQIRNNPTAADAITKTKEQDFEKLAQAVKAEDPDAYNHLKGQSHSRAGVGAESLFAAAVTTPFMILADFLIVMALLIVRVIVVFFPVIAVVGIHLSMRRMVISVLSIGAAAVLNAILFAVGGGVNALAVGILLGSGTGLPTWAALVLCLLVSITLWGALKPFRKLTSMVNPRQVASAAGDAASLSGARKMGRKFLSIAAPVAAGALFADKVEEKESGERWEPPPPPESFSRPPAGPVPQQPSAAQPTAPPPALEPARRRGPAAALPPGAPVEPEERPAAWAMPGERSDVIPPDAPLPGPVVRADPIMKDGESVYRIYNADTKTAHVVDADKEVRDARDPA